ncbi:MAG: TM0106 family RecB-like putative nuclease, partial [Bryobacteraceae bacterium]
GLEYLLGVVLQEDGRVAFRDWWAHDRTEERWAFEAFVHWVHGRWCQDPTMHIYHYAPYETTALKRLMGRYACCEQEIDDLLRNHVFVDLYTVLRQALIVGEPAYSLKNIEHLYMAKRDEEIATAGDSMVYYHRWLQERDGPDWTTSPTLRFIRAYNEADCRSTWKMMEWLRVIQSTAAIPFVPAGEVKQPNPTTNERAALAEAMLAEIPRDSADPEKWRVHALLSHLLEFHRREDKPSWWFLFDRAGMTEEELVGDPDCLGALERTARPPEIVKKSYRYEYRFDPAQESKLRDGKSCRFSHDIDLKIEIERIDYNAGLLYFTLGKSRPAPPSRLSLIPDDLVPGKTIVDSIERTVRHYRTTGQLPNAIQDFLYRVRPRIYGHVGGPLILDEADLLSSAKDIVGRMNETTLCIQGPPGCGKTYTGGELISSLLRTGKRVGVASNSHRAICLLLKSAAEAADRMGVRFTGAKAGADDDQEPIHQSIDLLEENGDVFNLAVMPDLVGGTAWVFSRAEAIGQFDYLFVDEAGQVSVANLVGMAPATKNIVLIGDQMQLNQPVQGTHPAESGQSVLEYLLGDQSTISEDRGIFLPRTWRMRSEVCRFISDGIYSGRVSPNPVNDTRRIQLRRGQRGRIHSDSGLVYISLDHDGNTYECSEEAAVIDQLVRELCSYTLELPNEAPKRLNLRDILIVAPFNLQVRKIQSTIPGARVGTVDKFQGQQAPVVVFSMTASEGDASSRGIDFLFSRNRLNVAISRAQILAVIVASSKLVRTRCSRLEQIRLVNLFCGATEAGQAVAVAR